MLVFEIQCAVCLINAFLVCSSYCELDSFSLNYNTSSRHFNVGEEMLGDYKPFYTTSVYRKLFVDIL